MMNSEDGGGAGALDPEGGSQAAVYGDLIRQRFPRVNDVLLQRLMRHSTFRDLCEEYAACTEVLRRLTGSASDDAMRREYKALTLRLEGELLRYISEHSDRPAQ